MAKSDFEDYGRRRRLYHVAFEEYDSLKTTYLKFYEASGAFKKRGRLLTYGSTVFGAALLFVIGAVLVRDVPSWGTNLAFLLSVIVAALSFVNAVDSPQRMSNVAYNSGQTLQRVYLDFHYFITVRIPDPDEDFRDLEEEYHRLLERKHIVNETTPQLGDKWYHRVKEYREDWEPRPLAEITGEDGEFEAEKDNSDEENGMIVRFKKRLKSPIVCIVRWCGF